jgi:seryl-tRNA synthetase
LLWHGETNPSLKAEEKSYWRLLADFVLPWLRISPPETTETNNMISKEKIESEIAAVEQERSALEKSHDQMVKDRSQREQAFQQQCVQNQNRFQQLQGSMATLKKLLNGQHPPESHGEPS